MKTNLPYHLVLCCTVSATALQAQVTATQAFYQYSMTAVQPTALPYNYLDKFDRIRGRANTEKGYREDSKLFTGWYANANTRAEWHPQTNLALSNVVAIDKISNPNQLNFQIGGGVSTNDLEAVQLVVPFIHASLGLKLSDNLRLLGGVGYQFGTQRAKNWQHQHPEDPKVTVADQLSNAQLNIFGVSAALVDIEKMYIGVGINRLMSSNLYQSADNQAFTEANLLFQYVFKASPNMNYRRQYSYRRHGRSSWSSSPNRDFLTNIHFSGAMRYLFNAPKSYKPHLQLNTRFSLTEQFWLGGGWNTSNRFQATFGYLRIPVFQPDVSRHEWQCWLTYDVPTKNAPRHGAELNLGYFF